MKRSSLTIITICMLLVADLRFSAAQVQIDKNLQMTGGTGDRQITGAETVDVSVGYLYGGTGATGSFLRGNGAHFVASPIQAGDLPIGSANYIQNQNSIAQVANFFISGDGRAARIGVGMAPSSPLDVTGLARLTKTGAAFTNPNSGQLEIYNGSNSVSGGAAMINFHRGNVYGGHFGLDTDNWFSTQGWSAGTGFTGLKTGNLQVNGSLSFTLANPTISASSYFVAPGGAYFNSGTVYFESTSQHRGGIQNDGAAYSGRVKFHDDVEANTYYSASGSGDIMLVGNDAWLSDINVGNLIQVHGNFDASVGGIQLGSNSGARIWGSVNGNIGINTNGPAAGSQLEIDGSSQAKIFRLVNCRMARDILPGNTTYAIHLPNDANTGVGRGLANLWTTYSDMRVKSDRKEIPYGIESVMKLQPMKYFHHNSDYDELGKVRISQEGEYSIGLLAQDVYEVIPEVVNKPKDESISLWSIDYSRFSPVLIKAIQEQQKIIENLQKQNNEQSEAMEQLQLNNNHEIEKLKARLTTQNADIEKFETELEYLKEALLKAHK